jgi:hypothetical protein
MSSRTALYSLIAGREIPMDFLGHCRHPPRHLSLCSMPLLISIYFDKTCVACRRRGVQGISGGHAQGVSMVSQSRLMLGGSGYIYFESYHSLHRNPVLLVELWSSRVRIKVDQKGVAKRAMLPRSPATPVFGAPTISLDSMDFSLTQSNHREMKEVRSIKAPSLAVARSWNHEA